MTLRSRRPLLIAALVLFALAFLLAAFLVQQAAAAGCDYTVQPGDTEYHIATTHSESVAQLQADNGLTGTTIEAGECLTLTGKNTETIPAPISSVFLPPVSPYSFAGHAFTVIDTPVAGGDMLHDATLLYHLLIPGYTVYGGHADAAGIYIAELRLGDVVTLAGRQYTVWRIRTVDGYAIPVSWGETLLYTCALQADPATPQTLVVEVH